MATTVLPILSEFLTNRRLRPDERNRLLGFYFPYFIIPLIFAGYMAMNPFPFPYRRKIKIQSD